MMPPRSSCLEITQSSANEKYLPRSTQDAMKIQERNTQEVRGCLETVVEQNSEG